MQNFKLMIEARKLHANLTEMFWETDRLEKSGKTISLVDLAERRYERRLRQLIAKTNECRKDEESAALALN